MIKYIIFFIAVIFSINLFTINQIELEAYYDNFDDMINKKIKKINIVQEGGIFTRLIDYSFITYTEDFVDSIISKTHFIYEGNDTFTTIYKLRKGNKYMDISSDLIDNDISKLKLEDYNLYTGHNFKVLLSNISEIEKTINGYKIRNIGESVFIDSVLLDKNKLPVYFNYNTIQGVYTIEINSYKHYYGFLHIPDSMCIYEGDTLFMYINIKDIEVISK